MKATSMAFERQYSDGSGVQYGVELDGEHVELESVHKIQFPVTEIDWLIDALHRIKRELVEPDGLSVITFEPKKRKPFPAL